MICFFKCLTALLQTASMLSDDEGTHVLHEEFNGSYVTSALTCDDSFCWRCKSVSVCFLTWLRPVLSSQHATCCTSTRWRWSPWRALRPLPRRYLRRWLLLLHLLPPSCTSRCLHKASHWRTTRGSESGLSLSVSLYCGRCIVRETLRKRRCFNVLTNL